MQNPFEFLVHHLYRASVHKDIIKGITISDSKKNYFGRVYYRVYVEYDFIESTRGYIFKSFNYAHTVNAARLSRGEPINDVDTAINDSLTKEEKLYRDFLKSKYFDGSDMFVAFNMDSYKRDELIKICDDFLPVLRNSLERIVDEVKDKTDFLSNIKQ